MTKQIVGQRIVTGITDQENVVTTDRLLYQTLGVAVLETGASAIQKESVLLDADFMGPLNQVLVDL